MFQLAPVTFAEQAVSGVVHDGDQFHGCAQLPADADLDHIAAEIENGELTIHVPRDKAHQTKGHTVEVQ